MDVYLTDISSFLPNEPVGNEQMEEILGMINKVPSRTRKIILRNNKIKTRHYAFDPGTGQVTHTNAQLAAEAIKRLNPYQSFSVDQIESLCCGTSSPDQLMPGHASMVHGELGGGPCEIISTAGICLSGITSMKYGCMNVALGNTLNAVSCGSELSYTYLRSQLCGSSVSPEKIKELDKKPVVSFEADFLRWMLSDGAGAVFISGERPTDRLSFRVDWIEIMSYANELETCMYSGAVKNEDGTLTGWRSYPSLHEAVDEGAFMVKQDAKLLNKMVLTVAIEKTLAKLVTKYSLKPSDITWFLPHYSSDYFRKPLYDHLLNINFNIPPERWFTNLISKGNTGAASMYIILEEFLKSGMAKKGDRILCFIPESGRFSTGYIMLTAV
jgi:3-oxoacyl-[acyl-carrier-protein] synthase III